MKKVIEWIVAHDLGVWAIGGLLILAVAVVGFLLWAAWPKSEEISAWSMQEAVFYGAALIAWVIFVRGL